ncbi:MAG: GNAT family N-acetyltransferase [Pirellulaceae bacterium]
MSVDFLPPAGLPADVLRFWRQQIRAQDEGNVLTRSPEWFEMMTGNDAARGGVAVLRAGDGAPRAIAPLLFRDWPLRFSVGSRSLAERGLRAAKICGGDFIDRTLDSAEVLFLLDALTAKYSHLDAFWFDHLLSAERLATLAAAAERRFFVHPLFQDIPHYKLRIPATEAEFKLLRSPDSVKKIQGRERALARAAGEVRLVELRSEAEWQPYEQRMVELMNETWQARLLGHGFSMDELRPVGARGWLRVFLLLAGEQMAAVAICYEGMETLVYEKIGYAQAHSKHSPGTLLLYRILEKARADGLRFIDFGEGEAEYKRQLANLTLRVAGCLVVRKSISLRTLFLLNSGWRKAIAAAGAIAKRTGWTKRLKSGAKKS